jgi:predicted nucleotidyltransferase
VRIAWLFGSRCRGSDDEDSDIDIAVLLPDNVAPIQRVEIGGSLSRRLALTLGAPVDLVVLNDAGSLLRYEATARGRLVFGDYDEAFVFERRARAAYEDLRHIQGFFTAALRDRLGLPG